jgi:hypothetical protein
MSAEQIRKLCAALPKRPASARRAIGRPLLETQGILPLSSGRTETFQCNPSLTREQIAWFTASSALDAGQPVNHAPGQPASPGDVELEPGDRPARPGEPR